MILISRVIDLRGVVSLNADKANIVKGINEGDTSVSIYVEKFPCFNLERNIEQTSQ